MPPNLLRSLRLPAHRMPVSVIGWDIGGVNTKAARVADACVLEARERPFELQRAPDALPRVLREVAADCGSDGADAHAITMTAELSQVFRTKREGVRFVLDAVQSAFPAAFVRVYTVDGRFLDLLAAREEALRVAAANWAATARAVARAHGDALLIDVGTTTTDIIPIVGGHVVARGWTDPDRLASGELVYTGAVRTPAEAMASAVPLASGLAGTSAEGFALAADVHIWRGDLAPDDYVVTPPDGRSATRECCGERLARVVCADREMLDDAAISRIAEALAEAQVARVAAGIKGVLVRQPTLHTAVVTGLGAFIGRRAAQRAGLDVIALAERLGAGGARCAPATSVALLLEEALIAHR